MSFTTSVCKKIICSLIPLIFGCTAPETRLNNEAQHLNFTRTVVRGTEFDHVVYLNQKQNKNSALHVYLDGDGTPWINNRWVSENPTTRNPLLLRLMSLENGPAIYLGRPCYHGFSHAPPCRSSLWTNQRYSLPVIESMTAALKKILKQLNNRKPVLIGYSGGGTLAMLMVERIPDLQGIVTIAANLDTDAWARLHGYSQLVGSINPARQPPLDSRLFQRHYAGSNDRNVPASLIKPTVLRQHSAQLVIIPEFDHVCCWEKIWASVLDKIQAN